MISYLSDKTIEQIDKHTILAYTISSFVASLMPIYLTLQTSDITMIIPQLINIIVSGIFIIIVARNHVGHVLKTSVSLFYMIMFFGMWAALSYYNPITMVYAISISTLFVLILRDKTRIIILGFFLVALILCNVYDLFYRTATITSGVNAYHRLVSVVVLFAGIIATIIINRFALEKALFSLRESVLHDHLTHAKNLRAFEEEYELLKVQYDRYNISFSLVYLDIDKFKAINDTYGHDIGDKVLQKTVTYFTKHLRELDTIYRIGGDEFIIIMRNTKKSDAEEAVKRVLSKIEGECDLVDDLHFSFGIADTTDQLKDKTMIKLADDLMYKQKNKKVVSL